MASNEDKKNQEVKNQLLQRENDLLKDRLKLQSDSFDMSSSLVESLKETLGIRTKQTTFEQNLLSVNKDINKEIFNQKYGLKEINDIEKQINKNNDLRNKSLIIETSLSQQISDVDKKRINQIFIKNQALQKQGNDLAKIMAMSKEERDIRKDEIDALQTKISRNEKYLDTSLKNLSNSAQQLLYSKEQRQELEKSNTEREKEKKHLEDQAKLLGLGGAAVEGIDKALEELGLGKLSKALGVEAVKEKMQEVAEEIQKAGGDVNSFANKMKVLKSGISEAGNNVMSSLRDPLSVTLFVVTELVEAMKEVDHGAGKAAKNFGISYHSALELKGEMNQIAGTSLDVNLTTGKLVESFTTLNNAFGTFAELSKESLVTFTKLTQQAGLSNEAAIALTKNSILNNKTVEETTSEYLGQVEAFKLQTGSAVNTRLVLEDISKISSATALTLGNTPAALAEAAVTARSLGLSIETVNQAAGQLLDFQSSIESELEAELLTGKDLNLEEARRAALNGDIATLSKEISKNIGTAADFSKMNVLQQEALAKSVGMSREDLAKTLMDQEVLTKLKAKEGETAQEAFNRKVKDVGLEQAKKELGDETLANQYASQSISEKFEATMGKVKEIFISLAEPLLPVLEIFADIFKIIGPIVGGISALVHYLAIAAKYVGMLAAGFYTLKFLGDSVYRTQILTNVAKKIGLITDDQAVKSMKAALFLSKDTVYSEGQKATIKKNSLGTSILTNIQERLGLDLKNKSLGMIIKESFIKAKDFAIDKTKLALQYMYNAAVAVGNSIKKIGLAISKSELVKDIGKAAMTAYESVAKIPYIGPILGIAAAASAIALGYKFMTGDDVVSNGYGKRTLLAGKDAIALNDEDTVIAGTDLGGKKKNKNGESPEMVSSSAPSIDITPLIDRLAAVEGLLSQILQKDTNIYMDSTKVGTGFAMSTSKVQ